MKPEPKELTVQQLVSGVLLLVLLLSSLVVGLVMTRFFVKQSIDDLPTSGAVNSSIRTSSATYSFNNGLPISQARPLNLELALNTKYEFFLKSQTEDTATLYGLKAKIEQLGSVRSEDIKQMVALNKGTLYYTDTNLFIENTLIWQLSKGMELIDVRVHPATNEILVVLRNLASEAELHLITASGAVNKLHNFGKLTSELHITKVNPAASHIDLRAGELCIKVDLTTKESSLPTCPAPEVKVANDIAGSKLTWKQKSLTILGTRVLKTAASGNDLLIWGESLATRDSELYLYNYSTNKLQEFMLPIVGVVADIHLLDGVIYVVLDNGNTQQVLYTGVTEIWTWNATSSSSSATSSVSSSATSSSSSASSSSSSSSSSSASSSSSSASSSSSSASSTSSANPVDNLPGRAIWSNITPVECFDELDGCRLTLILTD